MYGQSSGPLLLCEHSEGSLGGLAWWSRGWDSVVSVQGDPDSIPDQGNRSCLPQVRVHVPQLKILQAMTKTQRSQINKYYKEEKEEDHQRHTNQEHLSRCHCLPPLHLKTFWAQHVEMFSTGCLHNSETGILIFSNR